MKRIRRCFAATVLTLLSAWPVLAGQIPCGGIDAPPQGAVTTGQSGTSAPGEMPNGAGPQDAAFGAQGEISTGNPGRQTTGGDIGAPSGQIPVTLLEGVVNWLVGAGLLP